MFNELTLDFNSNEKTTEKFKILEFFALSTISKIYFGEFKYSFYSQNQVFLIEITFLDKPHNPLLNSGAIMSSAILLNRIKPDMKMSEKFDYVTEYLRKIAGGEFIG